MKKTVHNIHLVLGLASGIIVFIVAITGCLYAFKSEIESVAQPWRKLVPVSGQSFLPPSELKPVAQAVFPDRPMHGIAYGKKEDAAEILFYEPNPLFYQGVILNPYSGEIIKIKNYKKDFFYIVFQGHFQLWLPINVGQPIVAAAILIFVIILITGIILWWPGKNVSRKGFVIEWKVPWKRKLNGVHSVLGFYAWIILLVVALTGLVWGFQWFSKGLYELTGGDKELAFTVPESDTTVNKSTKTMDAIDYVWKKMNEDYPNAAAIEVHFPHDENESIYAHVNPSEDTHWKTEFRYFDRYSLEELETETVWGKMEDASSADKFRRLNYDIHVGAIGGLPGKILVFLASLIAASLPVTGFLMWWNKQKEKNKLKKGLDI